MLTGHRRYLLRQATGPTAGEVAAGDVNVLVGAFSDAQLYEDPWSTPPQWTPTSWEPASLARASAGPRTIRSVRGHGPAYRGEAIPYMIGAVKVGDLSMLPVWTGQDRETWEPHGAGDFRTSEVYSGRGMHRHYKGEAIPFMVGAVKIGQLGTDASGDLSMLPVWTGQDRETWEPHSLGDFRTSEVYSGRGMHQHYKGEAIPYMVGALPGIKARQSGVSQVEAARPSFKANAALAKWVGPTEKNQIAPTGIVWSACNDDNTTCAYGTVFQVGSAAARIALAEQAKQVALLHRVFTNVAGLGGGRVLVYFSNDPAAFLIADERLTHVEGVEGLFGIKTFDRKPEKLKEKLSQLEAKLAKWKAGESKPGFGESQDGLIKRINTLRKKLDMPELDSEGDAPEAAAASSGFVFVGNVDDAEDDEIGRGGRKRRRKKRKARRQKRKSKNQGQQDSGGGDDGGSYSSPQPQVVIIRQNGDGGGGSSDEGGSDDSEDD